MFAVANALGLMLHKQGIQVTEMHAIALAEHMDYLGLLADIPPDRPEERIYYLKDQGRYVAADGAGWLPGTFATVEAAREAQGGSQRSVGGTD